MNYKELFQLAQSKGFNLELGYKTLIELYDEQGKKDAFERTLLLELTLIQKWMRDTEAVELMQQPTNGSFILFALYKRSKLKTIIESNATYEEALLQGITEALKLI